MKWINNWYNFYIVCKRWIEKNILYIIKYGYQIDRHQTWLFIFWKYIQWIFDIYLQQIVNGNIISIMNFNWSNNKQSNILWKHNYPSNQFTQVSSNFKLSFYTNYLKSINHLYLFQYIRIFKILTFNCLFHINEI